MIRERKRRLRTRSLPLAVVRLHQTSPNVSRWRENDQSVHLGGPRAVLTGRRGGEGAACPRRVPSGTEPRVSGRRQQLCRVALPPADHRVPSTTRTPAGNLAPRPSKPHRPPRGKAPWGQAPKEGERDLPAQPPLCRVPPSGPVTDASAKRTGGDEAGGGCDSRARVRVLPDAGAETRASVRPVRGGCAVCESGTFVS